MRVRIVAVQVRQSFYVGDLKEVEHLLDKGYEIASSCAFGDYILYTLVMR